MRNEQWISNENFSVLGQIENLWMDYILEDIYIKFRETELVEIS